MSNYDLDETPKHDNAGWIKGVTKARIGIGRAGHSMPLQHSLSLKLAHAHARDAVYSTLNISDLTNQIAGLDLPVLQLQSKATNREQYIKYPDLGRVLSDDARDSLKAHTNYDVTIVIADGLSAKAINKYAVVLLKLLVKEFKSNSYIVSPVCLVEQGRVAIADEIGFALNSKLSLIMIGERPGLSAVDSMGLYLTYSPKPGLTDDFRNCISNIRQGGLDHKTAAGKAFYLVQRAFQLKLSGINLKDNSSPLLG